MSNVTLMQNHFYVETTIREWCEARDNCCSQFFERGMHTNDRCVVYQMILFV